MNNEEMKGQRDVLAEAEAIPAEKLFKKMERASAEFRDEIRASEGAEIKGYFIYCGIFRGDGCLRAGLLVGGAMPTVNVVSALAENLAEARADREAEKQAGMAERAKRVLDRIMRQIKGSA